MTIEGRESAQGAWTLSRETGDRLKAAIERAASESAPDLPSGISVQDATLAGYCVISIWEGGVVPSDSLAVSILVSPELDPRSPVLADVLSNMATQIREGGVG